MITRFLLPIIAATACGLSGCGASTGSGGAVSPRFGPHGGPVVTLPDNAGFAEVVVESVVGKKVGLDARVVAYFLENDLVTPLAKIPEDVKVKLTLPGEQSAELTMTHEANPKDPAGNAQYVSVVGPYSTDQSMGEISGKLAGAAFSQPFSSGR